MGKKRPAFKATDTDSVRKTCELLEIDPAADMIKMLHEETELAFCPHCRRPIEFRELQGKAMVPMLTASQRIDVHKELLQYLQPKLRATEIRGEVNHEVTINIVQYGQKALPERVIRVNGLPGKTEE